MKRTNKMSNLDDIYFLENPWLKYIVLNKRRDYWINDLYVTRETQGEYVKLYYELRKQPQKFFEYFRMLPSTFEHILDRISSRLERYSNFRRCIKPREKLTVTLRYLSTGMAFRSLAFSFRMSRTTIRKIVYEVCEVIWDEFSNQHMPFPTAETYIAIAEDIFRKWNFPNCMGCIDGKHIRLRCPQNSGSMYWYYKQYHSIVLQAVADANCRFLYIDVGAYGKQSDGGIFSSCSLANCLHNKAFNIPDDRMLPDTNTILPFVLLGDEAYPLKLYLMRPYSGKALNEQQQIFNYRLSRARRVVKCAFGILSAKWRILKKEIECHPDKVDLIIKCLCLLHNIIIDKEGINDKNQLRDHLQNTNSENSAGNQNISRRNNRSTRVACDIRDEFTKYFNSPTGALQFQENYI